MIFLLLYPTTSLSPRSSHTLDFSFYCSSLVSQVVLGTATKESDMDAGGIVIVVRMDCCRLVVLEYMIGFPTCFSYPFSVSLASCRFAVAPSLWDLKYGDAASTLQHCEDFINGCVPSLSLCLHGWVPVLFRFLGMQVVGHVLGLIKFLLGQKWIMEEARR